MNSPWLDCTQAAKYLGVTEYALRNYCLSKRINFGRVGRTYRFLRRDLDRFIMSSGTLKGRQIPAESFA